ncbi:MAG: hypothetical protein ACFCVG_14390 [Kineosporiaceae bacterium]
MTGLPLPALTGGTPLGFLAALGVLRLVTRHLPAGPRPEARLAWSPEDTSAVLVDAHADLDHLLADLQAVVVGVGDDAVLPGLSAHVPPPGEAPDKLRLSRGAFRPEMERLLGAADDDFAAFAETEAWLSALVTDLALDDKGRAAISQWTAPAGKQSMRTMLEKPLDAVRRNPELLREALVAWRRHAGVTGEYLDHRALFDAVDSPDGKASMRGVPGATWLALMAHPLFRTTSVGARVVSSGWRSRRAVYPLWSRPLDVAGVSALLHHPAVAAATSATPSDGLALLSIFRLVAVERLKADGQKSAGALVPVRFDAEGPVTRTRRSGR